MGLSLQNLRLFLAAAEDLHFSIAARRMHIAQPALSRAIRQLEVALGTDLFRRSTRKVELTEAGKLFQQELRPAISQLDVSVRRVREAVAGEAGTLRIGYMDFAIEGEFPSVLRKFGSRYPDVSIEARASFTHRITGNVLDGTIDVGFVVGPVLQPGLESFSIQDDHFVAVVPSAHRLAQKRGIRLRELADEPLILGRRESWAPYLERVEALCRAAGFVRRLVQEADTTESIFAFVASGIGCTLYVERAFHYEPPGVRILPIRDVTATVSTEVTWRRNEQAAVVVNFIGLCRELTDDREQNTNVR